MTRQTLTYRYQRVRQTRNICSPLETEDCVVQPNAEVSPLKWHLAPITWFFETVVLKKLKADYTAFNNPYDELFNSYYKAIGTHTLQPERGNLSWPSVAEVMRYRAHFDVAAFQHFGFYNSVLGAMESYFISLKNQTVAIDNANKQVHCKKHATLQLAYSHPFPLLALPNSLVRMALRLLTYFQMTKTILLTPYGKSNPQ